MPWKVKETPCFPNCWKVFPAHTYRETNDTSNYFADRADAEREAARRNLSHSKSD
jgi:hypothetical protein